MILNTDEMILIIWTATGKEIWDNGDGFISGIEHTLLYAHVDQNPC